ncbi:M28 family peptidase [Adhaeribacter rhizoryzae]|uniref:M28 family peptidase n=1 Tax=Adhaeribacter rhizoryzae TaxID=2607907 RepID=A0A5M6DHF5_9BACT|nr:M28 family peptidase [Adhaeribacter rhizoryzae]KAA5545702.1 M28 family peptidase [Adhaeribacter rhizoryzae]
MNKSLYPFILFLALGAGCAPKPTLQGSGNTSQLPAKASNLSEAAPKYAATITAADLSKHLHILASDEYEGRDTGQKGQKMAAAYIAKEFKEDGLVGPVKNSSTSPYYQTFDLEKSAWGEGHITVGSRKFMMQQDFFVVGSSPYQTEETAEVVFAGHGIDAPKYSDYTNLNVKDKMVVVLAGEPRASNGNYLVSGTSKASDWGNDPRTKRNAAMKHGAKSILVVTGTNAAEFNELTERLKSHGKRPTIGLKSETNGQANTGMLYVSPALGAALLNTTPEKLFAYRPAANGKPSTNAFSSAKNVKVKTTRDIQALPTENVLGFIEGTDKKDEIVVITAHYDHVGVNEDLPGDKIFNGANDDGSGTVAVIEMAEAFAQAKKDGVGPRRSMLFMTVTAEEKGLLGSEYYSNNPVFPLANTVANINIDMIGRMDKKYERTKDSNYIYVIGADKLSSELHQINEQANQQYVKLKLDYTFNDENDPNRFYYRSDHYNFAKHRIPIIFYFNGVHDDYHQPSDEVDKILFDSAEKVSRLAFYTAWEIANREERLKVDSNKQ